LENLSIFGGLGFVGNNISKQYKNSVIFDNNSNASRKASRLNYFLGDARNSEDLNNFFSTYKPKKVINLIANADIKISSENRFIDFELSPQVNLNLLDMCEKYNVDQYIYFSGSGVYGNPESLLEQKEDFLNINCPSMYAAAKISCEAFISAFCNSCNLNSTIFRPGNIVGPGLTHGLIYDVLLKIKSNPKEINILGNGTQKKSYIHIEDILSAIDIALNTNEKLNFYNLSSNDTITVKEIVDEIVRICETKTKINYGLEPIGWVGDVPQIKLDNEKMKNKNWHPKFNSLDAVRKTIEENLFLLN